MGDADGHSSQGANDRRPYVGPEQMRVEYINALTPQIGSQRAHDPSIEPDPALQG